MEVDHADSAIIYYIAGYIAKALLKGSCDQCASLISPGKVPIQPKFEAINNCNDNVLAAKEEFITSISRGGLIKPSDYIYVTSVHASCLSQYIFKNEDVKKSLLGTQNPREVFIESFLIILRNDDNLLKLLDIECTKGHDQEKSIRRIAFTIFNISAKNYVSELNDEINKSVTQKGNSEQCNSSTKIKKLQSN